MVNFAGAIAASSKNQKKKKELQEQRRKKQKQLDRKKKKEETEESFVDNEEHEIEKKDPSTLLGKFLKLIDPFIIVLILVNAVMMGVATFDFVSEDERVQGIFDKVDQIFLIIFTVEVSLVFLHYIRADRIQCIKGRIGFAEMFDDEREERQANLPWLVFDALVVILSWAFASVSVIRAFRILRALRLINKVETMKNVVRALIAVMPKMGIVAFLLSILFLVFGIMFTILFRDLYEQGYNSYDYFSRLDATMLTLFQIMTFDSWHKIARECSAKYTFAWVAFVIWVIITGFVVMNLIIAIICESLVKMNEEKNDALDAFAGHDISSHGSDESSVFSSETAEVEFKMTEIEELVDEILQDQSNLLQTVDDLKEVIRDIIENPPSQQKSRSLLRLFS